MFHGDRFRAARTAKGLTQQEVADLLQVGVASINRWENDKVVPDSNTLATIARALDVSADYLLGLTDESVQHVEGYGLSPMEWRLIETVRKNQIHEAFESLTALTESNK